MGHGGLKASPEPRKDFKTTPLFLGDATLDAKGLATATIHLPDNLTTFRIIAVASASLASSSAAPGRFGVGERLLQVQAPLVVRAALPRGLRPGDEAEIAAIVNNGEGPAGRLSVSLALQDVGGALEVIGPQQIEVKVAEGGQVRVPFKIKAANSGTARLTMRAALTPDGKDEAPRQDAVVLPLEVSPEPTLIEHVAIYGDMADDTPVAIPVRLPAKILEDFGAVSVSVDSTLLSGLQDATRQLILYPYGCAEQTSSRLLPLVALSSLTKTYPLGIEDPDALVRAGIARLLSMQTTEGGFSYWPSHKTPNAYVSAYATWILQMAARSGHDIPPKALERAYTYLLGVTEAPDRDWSEATLYYHDIRRAIAVHTLAEAGRGPQKAIDDLFTKDGLPLFARAFVLMAMHATNPSDPRIEALAGDLLGAVTELAGTAHTVERPQVSLAPFFSSDTRSTAILLMALLKVKAEHPLVSKMARGLMARRHQGAWRNTQENAYALTAMASYARIKEADEPAFTVKAWANDAPLIEAAFRGRQMRAARRGELSMSKLMAIERKPDEDMSITIHREGAGRAYYRLGMSYAPADPSSLPPLDRGLTLERALRLTEGPMPASGEIGPGQIVAMDLSLTGRTQAHYVVIDAPIPAGLEPINLDLGTGTRRALPIGGHSGHWLSHQELRNDRALLFIDNLPPGRHQVTVFLRATTLGSYSFPPARAEQMYAPETFGRTSGRKITVKP